MLDTVGFRLIGFIGLVAMSITAPASAALYTTPTQTLTFGPAASGAGPGYAWHSFSFAPFVAPDPTATFNSVHLSVTGTVTSNAGTIFCIDGFGTCAGAYTLSSSFILMNTVASPSPLPAASSFGPLVVSQTGSYSVVPSYPVATLPIPGATASATLSYDNTVPASGGTLDASHFTGAGPVDFTFAVQEFHGLSQLGGFAAVNFQGVFDTLTVSLHYDYTDIPEPTGTALLAGAAFALATLRQRAVRAWMGHGAAGSSCLSDA